MSPVERLTVHNVPGKNNERTGLQMLFEDNLTAAQLLPSFCVILIGR